MIMNAFLILLISALAAISDIQSRTIKNELILSGMIFGILLGAYGEGIDGVIKSLSGAFLPFLLLFMFFILHLMGGGDIKLMCSLGSLTGPVAITKIMAVSVLIGGVIGIIKLLFTKRDGERCTIRFAVPIFAGALLYVGGFY